MNKVTRNRWGWLTLLLIVFVTTVQAQGMKRVSAKQAQAMVNAIGKAAAGVRTIEASFTQQKTLRMLNDKVVSKGLLRYDRQGRLRWEYTSPYPYLLVVNGTTVQIKQNGRRSSYNVAQSQLYKTIASLMETSLTGKSLRNNKQFAVSMYTAGGQWIAVLKPKRGQFKKMFRTVTLHFNAAHNLVQKLEIQEQGGDRTVISLYGIRTNVNIPNGTFTIHQ